MASVNKVIIVGNIGRDPETKAFPSGDQICNIRVATADKWKDKQTGEAKEHTEWHSIVFNGRLAEIASQYLRKGSQVYVEGSLRTRKWTDKGGNERYSTEVRGDVMQMLGGRQESVGQQQSQPAAQRPAQRTQPNAYQQAREQAPKQGAGFADVDDDSLPF